MFFTREKNWKVSPRKGPPPKKKKTSHTIQNKQDQTEENTDQTQTRKSNTGTGSKTDPGSIAETGSNAETGSKRVTSRDRLGSAC